MGIVGDRVKPVDDLINDFVWTSQKWIDDALGIGNKVEDYFGDFGDTWDITEYSRDYRVVDGEATVVHPNMFLGLTGLRFVGVTRIPQGIAGAMKYIYENRNTIKGVVGKSKSWITNLRNTSNEALKNIKSGSLAKTNPLPLTTRALKKYPRASGMITGITAGTIISSLVKEGTTGTTTQAVVTSGASTMKETFRSFPDGEHFYSWKVSRKRWV